VIVHHRRYKLGKTVAWSLLSVLKTLIGFRWNPRTVTDGVSYAVTGSRGRGLNDALFEHALGSYRFLQRTWESYS
jgi:hypothetical protein